MFRTTSMVVLLTLTVALLPEVTQGFQRDIRAFKATNYERLPFKRASWDTTDTADDGYQYLSVLNKRSGGDISVEAMAERFANNKKLAQDFVANFMDADGDGYISAQELLPAKRR